MCNYKVCMNCFICRRGMHAFVLASKPRPSSHRLYLAASVNLGEEGLGSRLHLSRHYDTCTSKETF